MNKPIENIHHVDTHVGTRLRLRRKVMKMSQQVLAEALGVSFQQVQKYERGANRISASRMYDASLVLGVPVSYFFEGLNSIHYKDRTSPEDLTIRAFSTHPNIVRIANGFAKLRHADVDTVLSLIEHMAAKDE